MYKLLLFLSIYLLSFQLSGQNILQRDLVKSCFLKFDNKSSGTGCIYQDTLGTYLVTARHNLYEAKGKKFMRKANNCELTAFPRDVTKSSTNSLQLNLATLEKLGLIKYDEKNDIAVVKLGNINRVNDSLSFINYIIPHVRKLSKSSRLQGFFNDETEIFSKLELGNDIFVIGFPNAIGLKNYPQYDFNKPLLRRGIIAGKSDKFRTFVIDAHIYGGNSGGPVIKYTKNFEVKELPNGNIGFIDIEKTKLIGIVSQFIPFQEIWENKNYNIKNIEWDNSGYGVIVPIDYALKLIEEF
ncbi:MAG: serine protease [Bacteroidota bacterium]